MRPQRGQSLTEFAIGAAAFALIMLGSITLAGYQEVQRRTAFAARQGAFEAAWVGRRADYATTMRNVLVQHLDDPALIDAVGHTPYVDTAALIAQASELPAPGVAGTALRAMVEPLRMAGGFLGDSFDLSADRLLSGLLTVPISPLPRLPQPFASMTLQLQQPMQLMTDAWNAASPQHVRDRSAGLVPTTAMAGLQSLWRPLLAPLRLVEPSLGELCLGLIEPDRIPEDRLGTGNTPRPRICP